MDVKVPFLARLLRQQLIYIAFSAVIGAIFWAIGQRFNPATILVYSLCIGNLVSTAMGRLGFLYAERPFPHSLLIFVPLLLVLTAPIYLITCVAYEDSAIDLKAGGTRRAGEMARFFDRKCCVGLTIPLGSGTSIILITCVTWLV